MQNLFFFSRARLFARMFTGTLLLMLSVVSSVLLLAATGSSLAYAASGGASFSLQPVTYDPHNPVTQSYFIFDSKPGIVIKNRVRVTNSGTAKGTVGLYAVDATTGQTNGAVYLNRDDPRQDVGAWVTLGVQQLTLTPGQSKIVPFQVTIPGTIRPGQHLGGIVAENLTQQSSAQTNKNSTFQINVKSLTIVAVQVNLPGIPVEQMAASGVQAGGQNGYQQLLVGLSNTGTVMLKPSGSLQVSDAQGQVLKNIALKLDTFLPQTSIKYPVTITGQGLGPGNYQAALTLMYGQGAALYDNIHHLAAAGHPGLWFHRQPNAGPARTARWKSLWSALVVAYSSRRRVCPTPFARREYPLLEACGVQGQGKTRHCSSTAIQEASYPLTGFRIERESLCLCRRVWHYHHDCLPRQTGTRSRKGGVPVAIACVAKYSHTNESRGMFSPPGSGAVPLQKVKINPYKIHQTYIEKASSYGVAINRALAKFRRMEKIKRKKIKQVWATARMS